jgi:hypothetical protein
MSNARIGKGYFMTSPTRPPTRRLAAITAAPVLLLCLLGTATRGAGRAGEQAPDFPPGEFTDGGRYSLEDLKGKAVVLYLYEKL